MSQKALVVWGGWEGHRPEVWKDVAVEWLREDGFAVETANELECFSRDNLNEYSLIVPIWTAGQMTSEQESGLADAVAGGVGLAGWHGMCAAFNENLKYKWVTGGQMIAHPGDLIPSYSVRITDPDHVITRGLENFQMRDTEQYYLHVDPSNNVLATTSFDNSCEMPVAWTRTWSKGRVFYCSLGHAVKDLEVPAAMEIIRRGIRWAAR
jgi:type 1 glutamine amidotransferase